MKLSKHIFTIPLLFAFLLVLGVTLLKVKDTGSSHDIRGRAAPLAACSGQLDTKVSVDGKTPSLQITLPNPIRYYVHILSGGKPCSTAFDVFSKVCDTNKVCTAWKEYKPWGSYRSNANGVARIDLFDASSAPLRPGTYYAKIRPSGSAIPYGNEIQVIIPSTYSPKGITNQASAPNDSGDVVANLWEYFNPTPGYAYEYTTTNHITNTSGSSRLQIEEEITWCGFRLLPWRFTKDSVNAYHYPWMFQTPWTPGMIQNRDLSTRWLMASPRFTFPSQVSSYNTYITTIGEKRYIRSTIRDILEANHLYNTITGSTTTELPSYNLGIKTNFSVPYFRRSDTAYYYSTYQKNNAFLTQSTCPTMDGGQFSLYQPSKTPTGSWRIRAELTNIDIHGKRFSYAGPALRMDFYEGAADIDTGEINRETWYLVKNIGLVRLQMKNFNYKNTNYKWGTDPTVSTNCKEDPDCRGDQITAPNVDMVLDNYFLNPQLSVAVSADGITYANAITTTKARSYFLKTTNGIPYTGYLEALAGGKVFKWYWMENGIVKVDPSSIASLPAGTYGGQFRIWVPDDAYTNETRVSDTAIPWSNSITVNLQ